jgi:pyrimidine-nucleoside phosphorylase
MEQPLGYAIGNALEIEEALAVLAGGGPEDLRRVALILAGEQIYLANLCESREESVALAERILQSGRARDKFAAMVRAQGGDDDFRRLPQAKYSQEYPAPCGGYIGGFQTELIGKAAMLLGGGRMRKEDAIDPAVGLQLLAKVGDKVEAGQPLLRILYNDQQKLEQASTLLPQAITITDQPLASPPLVEEIVD